MISAIIGDLVIGAAICAGVYLAITRITFTKPSTQKKPKGTKPNEKSHCR